MYCIHCGKEIKKDGNFCPECGGSQASNSTNMQPGQPLLWFNPGEQQAQAPLSQQQAQAPLSQPQAQASYSQQQPHAPYNHAQVQALHSQLQAQAPFVQVHPPLYMNTVKPKKMKRTAEFVLGLIGGILGVSSSIAVIFFGEILDVIGVNDNGLGGLGIAALIFSVIGIVGSVLVHKKGKIAGLLMIIAAVSGLISIYAGYIIPFILLLTAGIISLNKPDQCTKKCKWFLWIPACIVGAVVVLAFSFLLTGMNNSKDAFYQTGEDIRLGNITYSIDSALASKTIIDDYNEYTTEGMFLTIDITVKNSGKEEAIVDSAMLKVIAEDGTVYAANSELTGMDLFFTSIEPRNQGQYTVVFSLDDYGLNYTLEVSDGIFALETAKIKLAIDELDTLDKSSYLVQEDTDAVTQATEGMDVSGMEEDMIGSEYAQSTDSTDELITDFDDDLWEEGADSIEGVYEATEDIYDYDGVYEGTYNYDGVYEGTYNYDGVYEGIYEGTYEDINDGAYEDMNEGTYESIYHGTYEDSYDDTYEGSFYGTDYFYSENYTTTEDDLMFSPQEVYYDGGKLIAVMYIYNGKDTSVFNIVDLEIIIGNGIDIYADGFFTAVEGAEIPPHDYITWTFEFNEDAVLLQDADLSYLDTTANFSYSYY
ncbi:MAG: hypothetical protein K0S76_392 [Herbinix sp.]|jgi:archaellum component FlaG (FlaF/FlaG flagellin family)|nr:hypothetical protein [Herbinix sp.]